VIAEGVETQEQLDLLAQEGCNLYQGFLCSRPGRCGDLASPGRETAMLAERNSI
jgi:EAL domain-containing protein (putative c-di-GMP-specific phosphodiesterase class I)